MPFPRARALEELGLLALVIGDVQGTINYEEAKEKMLRQYPMLSNYYSQLQYENYLDDDTLKIITRYINALDVYVVLYDGETEVTPEVVVAE